MHRGHKNEYIKGLKSGIPIALGYLSVSFTFGLMAVSEGLPLWVPTLISMSNLTSAGQFAALPLITSGAPMIELALTQLVINLRYALMSLSLTQKFGSDIRIHDRFLMAFFNTDEIFAVSSGEPNPLSKYFYYGLSTFPFLGWSFGTLIGGAAGGFLPESIQSALGIAIYAMFIAIIIPPAKKSLKITVVIIISAAVSCAFKYVPFLSGVSSGFAVIICTVIAAAAGALLFPMGKSSGKL